MYDAVKQPCKQPPFLFLTLISPSFSILYVLLFLGLPLSELPYSTLRKGSFCTLLLCLWVEKLWTMRSHFLFGFHFTPVCGKTDFSGERIEASTGNTMPCLGASAWTPVGQQNSLQISVREQFF